LNHQLTSRGASYLETTRTASHYRLLALADTVPPKPGLIRTDMDVCDEGIEVELWSMSEMALGGLMREVHAPLGIGTMILRDGRAVKGFICEGLAEKGARDITRLGGWRAYLASLASDPKEKDHG
ncbi:MAG: hypothetical protein M0003_14350, partial [Acidithiobacillus sp.]|nr:hypothetical protein [Acidithiobacillus sp.]